MPAAASVVLFHHGNPAMVDHTPGSDVAAGAVVQTADTLRICHSAIPANRLGALAAGDGKGVYRGLADGAIPADKKVRWNSATGKLSLTLGVAIGVSINATAADNDVLTFRHDNSLGVEILPTSAIAAAGSVQGDGTLLANFTSHSVSGADATKGVTLPLGGNYVEVYNEHATNGLKIYPPLGGKINGGTDNAAITIEGKTLAIIRRVDATNWAADFVANL